LRNGEMMIGEPLVGLKGSLDRCSSGEFNVPNTNEAVVSNSADLSPLVHLYFMTELYLLSRATIAMQASKSKKISSAHDTTPATRTMSAHSGSRSCVTAMKANTWNTVR